MDTAGPGTLSWWRVCGRAGSGAAGDARAATARTLPDDSTMTSSNSSKVSGAGCSSASTAVVCWYRATVRSACAACTARQGGQAGPAAVGWLGSQLRRCPHATPAGRSPCHAAPGTASSTHTTVPPEQQQQQQRVAARLHDVVRGGGVEPRRNLVRKQRVRGAHQHLAARHPLLLAAGAWPAGQRRRLDAYLSSSLRWRTLRECGRVRWTGAAAASASRHPAPGRAAQSTQHAAERSPSGDAAQHVVAHQRVGAHVQAQRALQGRRCGRGQVRRLRANQGGSGCATALPAQQRGARPSPAPSAPLLLPTAAPETPPTSMMSTPRLFLPDALSAAMKLRRGTQRGRQARRGGAAPARRLRHGTLPPTDAGSAGGTAPAA